MIRSRSAVVPQFLRGCSAVVPQSLNRSTRARVGVIGSELTTTAKDETALRDVSKASTPGPTGPPGPTQNRERTSA